MDKDKGDWKAAIIFCVCVLPIIFCFVTRDVISPPTTYLQLDYIVVLYNILKVGLSLVLLLVLPYIAACCLCKWEQYLLKKRRKIKR